MKNSLLTLVVAAALLAGCITSTSGSARKPPSDKDAGLANTSLGLNYMRQGNYELALEKLQRAVQQSPELPEAHSAIALVYGRLGEALDADRHYRRALQLSPADPDIQNNYGVFLCGQKRYDEAEQFFLRAAESPRYRTPEAAWTNAGVCVRNVPAPEKAERYLRMALASNSRFPDALWQMADLSFERGHLMQARAFLERRLEAAAATPDALWLGVRMEQSLGHAEVAQSYAARLKSEFPTSVQTRYLLELEKNGGSN